MSFAAGEISAALLEGATAVADFVEIQGEGSGVVIARVTQIRNALIIGLLVFTPWLFAGVHHTTQVIANCAATLLTVAYGVTKFFKVAGPARARDVMLAALTMILLIYGLVSACLISIDARQSAFAMWTYAGLAAVFWSTRDWIQEDPGAREKLIKIILVNAALIGGVGILQRLTATEKVLWIYKPAVTSKFYTFGPFEYRATAAQFFNLLWPVAVGFCLQARRSFFVWIAAVLAVCPLISSSRGGLVLMVVAAFAIFATLKMKGELGRISGRDLLLGGAAIILIFGLLGLGPLQKRWKESRSIAKFLDLGKRREQNENSWRIISDHPWFGVGPGGYEATFRAYAFPNVFRNATDHDPAHEVTWDFFYAKAHNDWLQTVAEWGVPAALLLIGALALCLCRAPHDFIDLGILFGAATLLLHGTFDYPLQNRAILCHFLVLVATYPAGAGQIAKNDLLERV